MAKIQIKNSFITSSAQITISSSLVRFSDNIRAKSITGSFNASSTGTNIFVQGGNSFGTTALIGSNDASALAFETNGSTRATIDTNGNLGIGTSSPSSLLYVHGTNPFVRINNSSNGDQGIKISYNNSDTHGLHLTYNPNFAVSYIDNTYPVTSAQVYGDIYFRQNVGGTMTTRMTIKADGGSVGIGTTSPVTKLHVEQIQNAESLITLRNNRQDLADVPIFGISAQNSVTDVAKISFYRGGGGNSGYLTFSTKFDNAASLTEKVRIDGAGNVGIGTTSPSSTKLHVVADWVSGHSTIKVQGITDNTTGYGFYNTSGVRAGYVAYVGSAFEWYNNEAIPIIFYTSGVERMRILSGGNVGIGTTSPNRKLVVYGDGTLLSLQSPTASSYSEMEFTAQGVGAAYIFKASAGFTSYAGAGSFNFYNAGSFGFHTSVTNNAIHIIAAGNVGIGTTVSAEKLSVEGSVILAGSDGTSLGNGRKLRFYRASDGWEPAQIEQIWTGASYQGVLAFKTNTGGLGTLTTKMVINNDGNVGIGTTSPTALLHVVSSGNAIIKAKGGTDNNEGGSFYVEKAGDTSTLTAYGDTASITGGTPDQNVSIWTASSIPLLFYIGGGERMRMTSTGYLGIGTTSPGSYLHIYGQSGATGEVRLQSSNGRTYALGSTGTAYGSANNFIIYDITGGAERLRINSDGNVGIGTTSPGRPLEVKSTNIAIRMNNTSNTNAGLEYYVSTGTYFNWVLGAQYNVSDGFEITPSTAAGGTTYSSPKFVVKANGNVGIGTTSPASRLDVSGSINTNNGLNISRGNISFTTDTTEFFIKTTMNGGAIRFRGNSGAATDRNVQLGNVDNNGSWTSYLIAEGGGNVGIGTTSPTAKLHIAQSNSGGVPAIRLSEDESTIQGPSANTQIRMGSNLVLNASSTMLFGTNGSEAIRVISDGNVGIGTTSPVYKLHVNGTIFANSVTGTFVSDGSITLNGGDLLFAADGGGTGFQFDYYQTKMYIGNNAGTTWHMVVQDNSNVGISTTSPNANLHVSGTFQVGNGTNFGNKFTLYESFASGKIGFCMRDTNGDDIYSVYCNSTTGEVRLIADDDNNTAFMSFQMNASERMRITNAGNVGIGTSSPIYKLDNYHDTIRYTLRTAEKTLAVGFPNGVANQKVDITFDVAPGNVVFWGNLQVEITDGFNYQLTTGKLVKVFAVGLNAATGAGPYSSAIFDNTSYYTAAYGAVADNWAIDGIFFNSTTGKYYITIVHRTSTGNTPIIKITGFGYAASSSDNINNLTAGAVYTTNTTVYYKPVVETLQSRIGYNGNINQSADLIVQGGVGIGTTSPGVKFEVYQTSNDAVIRSKTTTAGAYVYLDSGTDGYFGLNLVNAGTSKWFVGSYGTTSFTITKGIADTEYFRINTSGNVGIGTTSPAAKLEVVGNVKATSFTGSYSGLPNGYLYARRITSNQTISSGNWANIDLIFNGNVVSSSIKYNSTTGVASLTGGKVYRITSGLSWTNNAAYAMYWSLYKNSNNAIIGPEVSSYSVTYTINVNSSGVLEMIYAPTASIDVKIRTTSNSSVYGTSLSLTTDNSYIIIEQLA